MLVIDKPPLVTDPPILPPYLRKKGGPGKRVVIVPDLIRVEQSHEIFDHENNWQTTIYHWMNRITVFGEGSFIDPSTKSTWEVAHSQSRCYRQWLENYDLTQYDGIVPHVQFGGAIKTGESDPEFYYRWCQWAKKFF